MQDTAGEAGTSSSVMYSQQLCEDMGCSPEDLPEAKEGQGISVLAARHDDEYDMV